MGGGGEGWMGGCSMGGGGGGVGTRPRYLIVCLWRGEGGGGQYGWWVVGGGWRGRKGRKFSSFCLAYLHPPLNSENSDHMHKYTNVWVVVPELAKLSKNA